MISKNIFSRFFSFLAMATLLVACSQNDDIATTTTKDAQANRSANAANLPHGKLIINNNTQYTFIDYLGVVHLLTQTWVEQKIIINPYTNIELAKFSSTTTQNIDYVGTGRWIQTPLSGVSTNISEQYADTSYLVVDGVTSYAEWFSFDAKSTNGGAVKFWFKVDYLTGEIFVPDPQGTFTTTAFVNDSGDIVITLEE